MVSKLLTISFFAVISFNCAFAIDVNHLQFGDIIFQKSQSQQAAAISEATHSPWTHVGLLVRKAKDKSWYVAEATATSMDINPLEKFILRGIGQEFVVKRFPRTILDLSDPNNQKVLMDSINSYAGRSYDSFFEWSDNAIYCSELVWKSYYKSFLVAPGTVQKIGELDLSGPIIRQFVEIREKLKGSPVNLDEPIVTPISVMDDSRLTTVQ
jgi:hypothetical protein